MNLSISLVTVVVRDYDDAIKFCFEKIEFKSVENTYQAEQENRCVFRGDGHASVLLVIAAYAHQKIYVCD